MSLQGSLDRISATVQRAARVPMSASCVVNRAEILALVERARASIPVEVRDADALLARREKVLSTARDEAENTLTEAGRCAEQLVESSTIVARARERAEEIIEEAHAEAGRLRREADDYCDRQLADFTEELQRIQAQAARGRERLRHRGPEGAGEDGDEPVGEGKDTVPVGPLPAGPARPPGSRTGAGPSLSGATRSGLGQDQDLE